MQLQDHRHTTHTLEYNQLTTPEKDEYAILALYMRKLRRCSLCGVTFSLRVSLANGTNCPTACRQLEPRDHVDFNTEALESLHSLEVPYRLHLVLKSQGLWPTHPYIERCTKEVLPENSTQQPDAVVVYRDRFVKGSLATARCVGVQD